VKTDSSRYLRPAPEGSRQWVRGGTLALVLAVPLLLLLSAASVGTPFVTPRAESLPGSATAMISISPVLEAVKLGPYSTIVPGSRLVGPPGATPPLHLLVTLAYANGTRLTAFLSELSDPHSPVYHHYLTSAEFDAAFAPSAAVWSSVVDQVEAAGATNLTVSPDRVMIAFDCTVAQAERLFHTTLDTYVVAGDRYLAPSQPARVSSSIAAAVLQVDGLSNYSRYVLRTLDVPPEVSEHAVVPPGAREGGLRKG